MTFSVHVDGGTDAGKKRPLLPANTIPWYCDCRAPCDAKPCLSCVGSSGTKESPECRKGNPGYLVRCIDCGTDRDPA